MVIYVVGASGRSGVALCRSLADAGIEMVPIVRNTEKWAAAGLNAAARVADLEKPETLARALGDAKTIVSCAHARHTAAILAAAPDAEKFVFLGSTRKFTRWPDAHGNGVIAGESAFLQSGRRGVMLHPTMIYGAQGEDNVQRLAALLKKLPVVPLPGGGRALVQPIHQDDVTACIRAALERDFSAAVSRVIAGPRAMPYADFVRAVARAAGLRAPRIFSVPEAPLRVAARVAALMPFLPRIGPDEVRRLGEDKAFSIAEMTSLLSVVPRELEDGLSTIDWC
jgi:nucleoside-diphosphate-sugar epimerase